MRLVALLLVLALAACAAPIDEQQAAFDLRTAYFGGKCSRTLPVGHWSCRPTISPSIR